MIGESDLKVYGSRSFEVELKLYLKSLH